MTRWIIVQHSSLVTVWFAAWLATVGYLDLGFWQGAWALIAWPYYIGTYLSGLPA